MAEIDYDEVRKFVHLSYVDKVGTHRVIREIKGYLGEMHENISEYGIVAVLNPRDFELILQEAVENLKRKV